MSGARAPAGHHQRGAREAEHESRDLARAEALAQEQARQHRRPDRDQPDDPAGLHGGREPDAEGLEQLVEGHADEAHQRERAPRIARRHQRLAPRGECDEQQHGPERGAREDERDGRDLPQRRLGGDERDPPEDDGEEGLQARRHGSGARRGGGASGPASPSRPITLSATSSNSASATNHDHNSRPKRASRTRRARSAPGSDDLRAAGGERAQQRRLGDGGQVRLARVRVHGERAAHGRALDHAVKAGPLERRRDQARRARRGHQFGRHLTPRFVLDAPQAGRRRRASARPASAKRPPCRDPAP